MWQLQGLKVNVPVGSWGRKLIHEQASLIPTMSTRIT